MNVSGLRLIATVSAVIVAAGTASAGPISVLNASFETLAAGSFQFNSGEGPFNAGLGIPNWNISGADVNVGQWQPNAVEFNTLDDGPTVAYTNSAAISQTVSPTVLQGVVYTLTVDFGWRLDEGAPGAGADLLVNGVQYKATGTTPAQGGFSTYTATYTGLAGDVGDAIAIELTQDGTGHQAIFDNVTLSDNISTAPEPGMAFPMALGLVGACVLFLRKRAA